MRHPDKADSRLVSFMEGPCICGRFALLPILHVLFTGHMFNRASHVDDMGCLVATDGTAGVECK